MTIGRRITQLTLIVIGLFLILATYFLYPKIIEKNLKKEETSQKEIIEHEDELSNRFENVEYAGVYSHDNNFKVGSEKAYILKTEPDLVYMTNMKVVIHMNDGRIVTIISDRGKYIKSTYDCYFIDNVKATDGETIIIADNIDLLATQDLVNVYNNVFLTNDNGSLKADKVKYDLETRYYQISMFDNQKVKVKLIK